ncbi:MAG TPA: rod shape-determining protein MreD [Chloroflexota bacterium]|nr:rod shape-determining protein MreD [Chloroflexota bacterium]
MRYIVATLVLALEAALQASVFSRFALSSAAPQLVLLSVVAWSLARGPMEGMFWGFAGGLFYDLASGGPVGVSALAMLAVAAVVGSFGGRLFGTNPLLPMLAVFAATIGYFVIVSFLLATLHYRTDWNSALRDVALPTAVANGILSLIVYPLFAFVASHTTRQVRVEF